MTGKLFTMALLLSAGIAMAQNKKPFDPSHLPTDVNTNLITLF